ncbi:Crp/Fnr family transcriptional regulator [soil metagenome]
MVGCRFGADIPFMVPLHLLQTSPAFRDLQSDTLKAIAGVARKAEFRRDERIAPLINPPRRIVQLLSGMAKLTGPTVKGHERIVYVFRPGELVGSRVFLDESPEAAYEIVAMTRVEGIVLELSDLIAIGRDHPELLVAVTSSFSQRLLYLTDRLMAAMSEEVSVRLCRLLLDFVDDGARGSAELVPLRHTLTHETMANIVGASRPHTSSVLAELERRDVVHRRRRDLLVRPSGLLSVIRHEIDLPQGREARKQAQTA